MEQHFELLRTFVSALQANADLIHHPGLTFFRDYLTSLGATIPKKAAAPEQPKEEPKKAEPTPAAAPEAEEEEEIIPLPEFDNSGVIEAETSEPLPMGDENKNPSDEEMDKASEARDAAMGALSNGEFEQAVEKFTEAITLNPQSAVLYAKRASALLKLKKPVSAIADCDRAIKLNPDSAQAFKFRGRANRLLGKWHEAHADLATACKIDFDDVANEWLKEVEPNAKKLHEYQRALERKELQEKVKRSQKIREANRKAAEEAAKHSQEDDDFPGGMPGAGGLPPDFQEAMNDPELMNALMDIMSNPQNIGKYMGNPKIMKFIGKMSSQMGGMPGMGGMGGMGGMFGGMGGGCPNSNCEDSACGGGPSDEPTGPAPSAPKVNKVPEPDLD